MENLNALKGNTAKVNNKTKTNKNCLGPKNEDIIKDLLKLKNIVKNSKTKNFSTDDKVLRDIRTLYESKEDYHKQIKINNAFNDDYIEYESNCDKNKILSVKEYHDMIRQ